MNMKERFRIKVNRIPVEVPEITEEVARKWIKDYDKSIEKMKNLTRTWRTVTTEMLRELYIARESLRNQGHRSDLFPNGSKTFKDYLDDIGLPKTTAYNWLNMYDAENNKKKSTKQKTSKQHPKQLISDMKKSITRIINKLEKTFENKQFHELKKDIENAIQRFENKVLENA